MKRVVMKLKYDEVLTLDQWLGVQLEDTELQRDFAGKSLVATLMDWQLSKLKPRTYRRYEGKTAFRMNPPVALAFAWLISESRINTRDYLGGKLLAFMGIVDQVYS